MSVCLFTQFQKLSVSPPLPLHPPRLPLPAVAPSAAAADAPRGQSKHYLRHFCLSSSLLLHLSFSFPLPLSFSTLPLFYHSFILFLRSPKLFASSLSILPSRFSSCNSSSCLFSLFFSPFYFTSLLFHLFLSLLSSSLRLSHLLSHSLPAILSQTHSPSLSSRLFPPYFYNLFPRFISHSYRYFLLGLSLPPLFHYYYVLLPSLLYPPLRHLLLLHLISCNRGNAASFTFTFSSSTFSFLPPRSPLSLIHPPLTTVF